MLSELTVAARGAGLEIHPEKTKIPNNGLGRGQNQMSVLLDGSAVEILTREDSTMYLGRLLNLVDVHDTEINHRVKKAWAKFAVYRKELTDKWYSLFQRMRLFNLLRRLSCTDLEPGL